MRETMTEPHVFVNQVLDPRQCVRCACRKDHAIHDPSVFQKYADDNSLFPRTPTHPMTRTPSGHIFSVRDETRFDDEALRVIASESAIDALKAAEAEMVAKRNAYILQFFGSLEVATLLAPYFVLEESQLESFTDYDIHKKDVTLSSSMTVRLRPKTSEELEDDGLL